MIASSVVTISERALKQSLWTWRLPLYTFDENLSKASCNGRFNDGLFIASVIRARLVEVLESADLALYGMKLGLKREERRSQRQRHLLTRCLDAISAEEGTLTSLFNSSKGAMRIRSRSQLSG